MVQQYGFYSNSDACIGCRTCVVACKDKNDLPLGEKYRRVYDYGGGSWDISENGVLSGKDVFSYSLSVACMHCSEPACMASCPVDAIVKREDGIVYINSETCIGCGTCVTACPFGVPYMRDETGLAYKCDFCKDLIEAGENPACVDACVMRCIEYGELSELQAKYGDLDRIDPLPSDPQTGPSVVFTRSRLNPDGTLPGMILNAPEELESVAV